MAPASSSDSSGQPTGNPSDGQQTSVPYAAIPFLAILGAVALMLIVWAFARLLADPEPNPQNFPDSQMQYMREVRQRNRQDIADLFAHRKGNYSGAQQQMMMQQQMMRQQDGRRGDAESQQFLSRQSSQY